MGSLTVLIPLLLRVGGLKALASPHLGPVLLRALILCGGYYTYVLAIAAMPMANGVAIYFTMPFFVAGLAFPVLGERVSLHRWLAIIAGFIGVTIIACALAYFLSDGGRFIHGVVEQLAGLPMLWLLSLTFCTGLLASAGGLVAAMTKLRDISS